MRTKNSSRNGTKHVFIVHLYKYFPIKAIMSMGILRSLKCKFNCLFSFSKNILVRHCQRSPKIFPTYYCQLTRGISLKFVSFALWHVSGRGWMIGPLLLKLTIWSIHWTWGKSISFTFGNKITTSDLSTSLDCSCFSYTPGCKEIVVTHCLILIQPWMKEVKQQKLNDRQPLN